MSINTPYKEIAEIVGCSIYVITNIACGNSRKYLQDKYHFEKRTSRIFTDDQVHCVCKLLETYTKDGFFNKRHDMYKYIIESIGVEYNDSSIRAIERIHYKITHKDIVNKYNY